MAKKEKFPLTHSGSTFIKDEHLYDFRVFTIPSYTSAPDGGLGGESAGGARYIWPPSGTTFPGPHTITTASTAPPDKKLYGSGDKYLPVLERIATALEAIVERFC